MPIQKFTPKPGVNRENTRLFNEGGWWDCDKIRFRQGTPERIGGWERISSYTYQGVCRSMTAWATIAGTPLTSVGTHLKYYIANGGVYNDITPLRTQAVLSNPITATSGANTITLAYTSHGANTGDFISIVGALALSTQTVTMTVASPCVVTLANALPQNTPVVFNTTGALPTGLVAGVVYYAVSPSGLTCMLANVPDGAAINTSGAQSGTHTLYVNTGMTAAALTGNFQVTVVDNNTLTIDVGTTATVYDTAHGGAAVRVYLETHVGSEYASSYAGWGAGAWGAGTWGVGGVSTVPMRVWSQANFGQDLVFGYRNSSLYYWNALFGTTPQVALVSIATPCVISLPVAMPENTALVLETTGTLPTGLSAGTIYYVRNSTGVTANLSATPTGALVNTSGTQSGLHTLSRRAIPVASMAGASDVPVAQNLVLVSDTSRFVLAFGVNPIGATEVDPMFIRWSDQESAVNWTPAATNQAGGQRLSQGSKIVCALQTRQEIVVFTDSAMYSLQYMGPPYVWKTQLLADNISFFGINTAATASGTVFWMGADKFYRYDGRVQTVRCDLKQYIFSDINTAQADQFFAGTNEGFNEVWWFYCSAASITVDKYVVYNYVEDVWYYGTLARTAWLDSGLNHYPVAATYANNLVYHEFGLNDNVTGTPAPVNAFIASAEFDIGDGDHFGFVWRVIPDMSFRGSTAAAPTATLTLNTLKNSGSGYTTPGSVGGSDSGAVVGTAMYPVEQFTGQINTRVRGRQLSMRMESNQLDTTWQLGATRIDVRPDGRR